jgi:hypothetical protein
MAESMAVAERTVPHEQIFLDGILPQVIGIHRENDHWGLFDFVHDDRIGWNHPLFVLLPY